MKRSYKDFEKQSLGASDIGSLIVRTAGSVSTLSFGEDGSYQAYICKGDDVEIGSHYEKVFSGKYWLKIYDDFGLTYTENFGSSGYTEVDIYQAGNFGCIIHWHN